MADWLQDEMTEAEMRAERESLNKLQSGKIKYQSTSGAPDPDVKRAVGEALTAEAIDRKRKENLNADINTLKLLFGDDSTRDLQTYDDLKRFSHLGDPGKRRKPNYEKDPVIAELNEMLNKHKKSSIENIIDLKSPLVRAIGAITDDKELMGWGKEENNELISRIELEKARRYGQLQKMDDDNEKFWQTKAEAARQAEWDRQQRDRRIGGKYGDDAQKKALELENKKMIIKNKIWQKHKDRIPLLVSRKYGLIIPDRTTTGKAFISRMGVEIRDMAAATYNSPAFRARKATGDFEADYELALQFAIENFKEKYKLND